MEFTGKTIEEAKLNGLKELGLTEEEAEIKVIEDSVKGIFGKIKVKARVDVRKKRSGGERAVDFLDELFEKMNIVAKAELKSEGETVEIEVIASSSASVIGYRGEVLDAFQSLAGAVANTGNKTYKRVVIDCEGYREKREETLKSLAKKLADKAVRQGRNVSLEPMTPYERRVIHSTLADREDVTTTSEGKEPNRYVLIVPAVKKEFKGGKKRFDKRDGGKRNGGRRDDRGAVTGEKRKKPSGFGTYIGNSLKDNK